MRTESKSPICLRIDAVTQKVEAALKDIPALRKIIKKQRSYVHLQIPKPLQQSKSTSSIALQYNDRSRLKTESILQLQIGDDKEQSKIKTKRTDTSIDKQSDIQKSGMLSFRSIRDKIKDLDISKINNNQNLNIPSGHISPMSGFAKSPRHLNFKSLSNLDFSNRHITSTPSQKGIQLSPIHVQLDVLEIPQHNGYHEISNRKQQNKRSILSEQLKHKMAMKIRQRIQFNKLNPQSAKKHQRQNSYINLRETLIRRVSVAAGIIN